MAKRKPLEPYDPRAAGCACRVCREKVTPPTAAELRAVPDELAEAFEEASFEACHAHNYSSPIASEDAYIRGGILAVLAVLPTLGWTPPGKEATACDKDLPREVAADAVALAHEQAKRADQAEDLLRVAHETSNLSEAARARAVQRAEEAERDLRTEKAEASLQVTRLTAALKRVRELAAHWASLAPDDDWGESASSTITADLGRAVLAALDLPTPGGAE